MYLAATGHMYLRPQILPPIMYVREYLYTEAFFDVCGCSVLTAAAAAALLAAKGWAHFLI